MSALLSLISSIDPRTDTSRSERAQLSQIDSSMRGPTVLFLVTGVLWLLVGTAMGLISAIKLHNPEFMGSWEWFTFGRTRSAHLNAVAYGWGNNVAFAVALWVMARLCRTQVKHLGILYVAGAFWNFGILWGITGIMTGGLTSVEWLEMPPQVAPLLGFSYALIGLWGILCFHYRQAGHVYVSQWYILAALFWFPWLYITAELMILWVPARGVVQSLTNWWFGHNALGLWYTPVALGAIYYFLPKVLGRPIYSYYLSVLGFWTLALFYNWAGVHHLIYGPIPVWLQTAGIVGSVMMVVPVIVTAINHHMTAWGNFTAIRRSPTLRFVVFGAVSYTLASMIGSLMALRPINVVTHFTHFTVGHSHHGLYAFFTMTMFGAIYFMMPRLLDREWPSARLISWHFWCTAIGITIMLVVLQVGGWFQGQAMNNPYVDFNQIVADTRWMNHWRSISGTLIAVGHIAFFINVVWMLVGPRRPGEGPTLLTRTPWTQISGGESP